MLSYLLSVPVLGVIVTGIGKALCFVASLPPEATQKIQEGFKIGCTMLGVPCQ